MRSDNFTFKADDGQALFVYRHLPAGPPRGVVHIAHGMAEHAARYTRFAKALTDAGFAVYANDHRGHGRTAAVDSLGFFASSGGFLRVVRDLEQLLAHEQQQHPGLPLVLFGHSMGSFFCQEVALRGQVALCALILSGTSGKPSPLAQAGRVLARIERKRLGERGRSDLLNRLSFGDFNRKFAPNRTAFDWLSRDEAEVDRYIADALCGFPVTTSLWVDVLDGTAGLADPARQAQIRKDLPIYLFAGARDPVGESGKSVTRLADAYRAAGLRRVTLRLYPDARHELLNETNRDEVTRELLAWLDQAVPRPAVVAPADLAAAPVSTAAPLDT